MCAAAHPSVDFVVISPSDGVDFINKMASVLIMRSFQLPFSIISEERAAFEHIALSAHHSRSKSARVAEKGRRSIHRLPHL